MLINKILTVDKILEMKLSVFLQDLLEKGHVTVANEIINFEDDDLKETSLILKNYYAEDKLEMPYDAPDFSEKSALWAVKYLYHSIQLALLRNLDEQVINNLLEEFKEEITPETIYSVDLSFRYLPELFNFIKGLAPDDLLVKCLEQTAVEWPFSSIGIELKDQINNQIIFKNKSLTYTYIDRIIKFKDLKRVKDTEIANLIKEVLGNYSDILWADFLSLENDRIVHGK